MFCRKCGQQLSEGSDFCDKCGTLVVAASAVSSHGAAAAAAPAPVNLTKNIQDEVKSRTKDAWAAIKLFAQSPVGGLQQSFEMLGSSRALSVGVIFAIVYEVLFFWGIYRFADHAVSSLRNIIGGMGGMGTLGGGISPGEMSAKLLIQLGFAGVVPFITLTASGAIARKIFRGKGSVAGDIYIAGACLLPQGLFILVASFLGVANFEVIMALFVFAVTYSVLMLFAGCSRISAISEAGAAPAVPLMLLLSLWLTKVVVVAVLGP